MIIGFSRYGRGKSGPVLDYLGGYLGGGKVRDPKPEVVRGDPKSVARIIDSLPFQRRYSSGVLSFATEDVVSSEAQEDIMNRFESAVFAGLPADRRSIVWIKHTDKGRTELHFVVPRVDLGTRKSLNIAPPTPSSRHLLDTLRESINRRYGFRDPTDPTCAQSVSLPAHIAKLSAQAKRIGQTAKADIRQTITSDLEQKILAGAISNRSDVIRVLKEQGFTISREGINYLTIVRPDTQERIRLKGNIYREHFQPRDLQPTPQRHDPARLFSLEKRLELLVEKRAAFHRARYEITEKPLEPLKEDIPYDRTRNPSPHSHSALGENSSLTRATVDHNTFGFNAATHCFGEAIHNLERTGQRLGEAHRTLAVNFDQAVNEVSRINRANNLIARYGLTTPIGSNDQGMEMEIEL